MERAGTFSRRHTSSESIPLYGCLGFMKPLKLIAIMGGALLIGASGILAATNPDQTSYESFAATQLTHYLGQEVCGDAAKDLGLGQECEKLLRSRQSAIRRLVARQTERQNFLLFSIYRTNLELMAFLPSYQFETVAALGQFHIYKSEKN
jgi:Domain of unknown function (DUF4359)